MTTASTAPVKRRAPVRRTAKKAAGVMPINHVDNAMPQSSVCHACNHLPVGSVELTALMLVLVFSLTAVLFTSVYALQKEKVQVAALEARVAQIAE